MSFDKAAFFAAVRARPFGGSLTQKQVDGLQALLDFRPKAIKDQHLAYGLATAFHETARTLEPVKEYGGNKYFERMYDIRGSRPEVAKQLGNVKPGDGVRYAGRGFVQLTGRSNYRKAGQLLGISLEANPGLAMGPKTAAKILWRGMTDGWFTGKKFSDFDGPGHEFDAEGARRIVNGNDRAKLIATYYRDFLIAVLAAQKAPATVNPPAGTVKKTGWGHTLVRKLFG